MGEGGGLGGSHQSIAGVAGEHGGGGPRPASGLRSVGGGAALVVVVVVVLVAVVVVVVAVIGIHGDDPGGGAPSLQGVRCLHALLDFLARGGGQLRVAPCGGEGEHTHVDTLLGDWQSMNVDRFNR